MEALTFLKFWKTITPKITTGTTTTTTAINGGDSYESATVYSDPFTEKSDEDDDSFFELELTSSHNYSHSTPLNFNPNTELKSTPKPQSPISILRSASPKLRGFTLAKFRKASKLIESECDTVYSTKSPKRADSSLFMVKFEIEDGSIVPKFTRSNSSSLSSPRKTNDGNGTSKRFSKEAVSKYINKIKPLYTKSTKKSNESVRFISSPARSTVSILSPKKESDEKQSNLLKVKRKYLGKCKSDSSMITGGSSPLISPVRSDHPCDGIESAILHCKLSHNSPKAKGKSALSRCSSDPSHDKAIQMSE